MHKQLSDYATSEGMTVAMLDAKKGILLRVGGPPLI